MIQFGDFEDLEGFDPKAGPHCIACEAMLTDAVDETLGEIDRAWFDQHIGGCVRCAEKLAQAQRGSAWLEMLKSPRPEPGPEMMARILAQTTGNQTTGNQTTGAQVTGNQTGAEILPDALGSPAWAGVSPILAPVPRMAAAVSPARTVLPFRPAARRGLGALGRVLLEPRLAMTAAMAFFSVALTLNLTGVRLNQLHASDLNPANLRRDYFQASARAVQYYDNLRVVHVMESRVEDLKQAAIDTQIDTQQRLKTEEPKSPAAAPDAQPDARPDARPQPDNKPNGTSRRENPGPMPHLLLTGESAWAMRPAAMPDRQNVAHQFVERQIAAGGQA